MSRYKDFLKYVCQTSANPVGLEVEYAEGVYLHTTDGNTYLDFISGIGVNNLGFSHPAVVAAVQKQAEKYMHVMVYGEYVQAPQVDLAKELVSLLPASLNQVYFTNSGTEANEGALKLAKKFTGRKKLVSFEGSFHGDTHGSCSVTGRAVYRTPFEPLLPQVVFLPFNETARLNEIDETVAAVIIEPIQGEGGMCIPGEDFLKTLRARCDAAGALLIFDEVQTGFGRTGKLFALEHWGVVPDILTLAKGMGGGMPLGAFVASEDIMKSLSSKPALSHVTTFGGHPVSCAAGLAALKVLSEEGLVQKAYRDGLWIREQLRILAEAYPVIRDVRGLGLMIGLELESADAAAKLVTGVFKLGVILGWTLHTEKVIRIMPPLIISSQALNEGLSKIASVFSTMKSPDSAKKNRRR